MSTCGYGYVYSDYTWATSPYSGHRYARTLSDVTWYEGEALAQQVGGHLATIRNSQEQDWVVSTFYGWELQVWIGLYQDHNAIDYSEPTGGWRWVSGEPVAFTAWADGQPDNMIFRPDWPGEDHGCLWTQGNWDDAWSERYTRAMIEIQPLKITDPNGGEKWVAGKYQTIRWQTIGTEIDRVRIDYSTDGGTTWHLVDANTPNCGQYQWMTPNETSERCYVRVSDVHDTNVNDRNRSMFTIFVCHLSSKADLNEDCRVNYVDFAILAEDWLRNGNPLDEGYTEEP
jgi:hypothetical protein